MKPDFTAHCFDQWCQSMTCKRCAWLIVHLLAMAFWLGIQLLLQILWTTQMMHVGGKPLNSGCMEIWRSIYQQQGGQVLLIELNTNSIVCISLLDVWQVMLCHRAGHVRQYWIWLLSATNTCHSNRQLIQDLPANRIATWSTFAAVGVIAVDSSCIISSKKQEFYLTFWVPPSQKLSAD